MESKSYKTNLGNIAHIIVDEKTEVCEVDIGRAAQVKVVKSLNVKVLAKRQSTEII